MLTENPHGSPALSDGNRQVGCAPVRTRGWSHYRLKLASLCLAFLGWTVTYSFLIPAWEANDELDHVANIEYAVKHPFTFMPIRYHGWHETHQPPIFYWIGAAWQRLLGIKGFDVSFPPWRSTRPEKRKLILAHDKFNKIQQEQATALHKLRLVAPMCGLLTIVLVFLSARQIVKHHAFALSTATAAALHPKFLIISSVISNDSMAAVIGAGLLFLVLRYVSHASSLRAQWLLCIGIGLLAGLAMLTKLTLLPMIAVLVPLALVFGSAGWRVKLFHFAAIVCFGLLVCGAWLLHNRATYGDWLAMRASAAWLTRRLPHTMYPVSYFNADRFLDFVPKNLFQTLWYNGGWNQNVAPFALYFALWLVAAACLFAAFKAHFLVLRHSLPIGKSICLWASAFAALAAIFMIAREATQAEGRIALAGLSSFAIILNYGSHISFRGTCIPWLGLLLWPVVLLCVDCYVAFTFVLPVRHW